MISLKLACVLLFAVCFTLLTASSAAEVKKGEAASDLDASESQSYGYGYGTKVADKYSVSTGKSKSFLLLLTQKYENNYFY